MKILQVAPRYPPRTGGVETHVRELSERLVERGHEVIVVTADAGDDVDSHETQHGVAVRRHRGFSPGGAFHVAPGVFRSVCGIDADLVHAHNYHALPLAFAAAAVREERLVVTPHYHGASASEVRDRLLALYRPLGRWALHRGDAVTAVSKWERGRLRQDFGVEAGVVPNGLDVERFRDAVPEERDRPYLLTVGRLEEYKGVQHAIRALPSLPDYELLVAGSGPYGEGLETVARDVGVADRVSFLGYVEHDRLPNLYAGAAVFLTLSAFEAYGMTVGEALTAGTPAVVRKSGALTDWTTRDDVVGVADVTPEAVAAGVASALELSAPESSLPTWDEVTGEYLALYESLGGEA